MTIEERVNAARNKAEGYRLLAECYYPPDERLGVLIDDLAACLIPLATHIEAPCSPASGIFASLQQSQDLIGDYSKLFLGPFATIAPPYGSVYLDPTNGVMGSSTAHVLDCYLEMGLDISDSCREAPDHISVELEFMHFLCIREAQAANQGDLEAALHFSRKQRKFITEGMAWICEFTERIRARAGTAFYRGLAECTSALIDGHLEEIRKVDEVIEPQSREGRKEVTV